MVDKEDPRIYLDWAATAPLCREAYEAMEPFLIPGLENLNYSANANSLHTSGRKAFAHLENARLSLARNLGASRPEEIIFTSGASEANNMVLKGIVSASKKKAILEGKRDFVPHIITTEIEHDSILAPSRILNSLGCEVSYLRPNKQGYIDFESLKNALNDSTVLVSIQMANNEIGSIQAIQSLAEITHRAPAIFHTDAVQALGKLSLGIGELGVDAASFSAHKIGGPKGVGALYLKSRTPFDPLIAGGGQEFGKRSGTQNIAGAVGFAAAYNVALQLQEQEAKRLRSLRDYLYASLSEIKGVHPSVEVEKGSLNFLPHIVNIYVDGMESETMILRLDLKGVEVSGGSACSSHSLEPSHVLRALGLSGDRALGSLRVSMGRYTEKKDIDIFLRLFKESIS